MEIKQAVTRSLSWFEWYYNLQNTQILINDIADQRHHLFLSVQRVFTPINVINKPFLDIVNLQTVPLHQNFTDLLLVSLTQLAFMAVVNGSLIEIRLRDAVILTSIDEALEYWKPASDVNQHLVKSQSMSKSHQGTQESVFIWTRVKFHLFCTFTLQFEQIIGVFQHFLLTHCLSPKDIVHKGLVNSYRIPTDWDDSNDPFYVLVMVKPEESTHDHCTKRVNYKDNWLIGPAFKPLVQIRCLYFKMGKMESFFGLFFSGSRLKAFGIDHDDFSWDSNSLKLIIDGRESSNTYIEIIFPMRQAGGLFDGISAIQLGGLNPLEIQMRKCTSQLIGKGNFLVAD